MKIVIASDSFKGSLCAVEVCRHIARGVKRAVPGVHTVEMPVSDGGEGLVDVMIAAAGGDHVREKVEDPLGREIDAEYAVLAGGKTAVVEMAAASGLPLLAPEERNPLKTSTFGTGQLIRSALGQGVDTVVIGLGGSATVDGGAGMAEALGMEFLNSSGEPAGRGGGSLSDISSIRTDSRDARLDSVNIRAACDVDNPLTGDRGASVVYGPQKGASPEVIDKLENGMKNLAGLIRTQLNIDIAHEPGSGAAGGLGGGIMAFAGGTLEPGIDLVLDTIGFDREVRDADLVITGEGKIDEQTLFGKVPVGVSLRAKVFDCPVIAIGGALEGDLSGLHEKNIRSYFSMIHAVMPEEELFRSTGTMLETTSEQIIRTFF